MWNTAYTFSNKSHILQKKLFVEKNSIFSVDHVKVLKLYVVRTWRHMQSECMK